MGILINTGFDLGGSSPIDNRTVKNTTDERDALISDGLVYENLKVYCKDTQKEYRWTGTEWEEVGTGGTVDLSGYAKTYTSLTELGLTADTTVQYVMDALPKGSSALLGVKEFTNYQTIFPYKEGNDQFARVHIVKGLEDGSCMYARWFRKDGVKEAIAKFNINDNKFNGWQQIDIRTTKKTLAFNSKTFKIDITKGNENWNGNMKFGYCVDNCYGEIIISSIGTTKVTWSCSEGIRYVKSVTYTIDPDNKAHVTIGVEFNNISYGVHQLETSGDFATINSFTGDAFTGTSVAERQGVRGRNNGVGILCDVVDLGLTLPCTTVQIVQAMRNMSVGGGGISANVMIGIFNCGSKAETITDAPSDYGLLHVETFTHDRVLIRFDGIRSSNYAGSWIGQIKGNNGIFSSITWTRIDNDTRVTTLETQVNELFQSVSSGKKSVANAITGKGVSTSTTATFATMATNIGKITNYTASEKEALATAITGKGVITSSTASFSTMAANISKIQNVNSVTTYKEETKSVGSSMSGMMTLSFTFSAKVLGVKKIIAPKDGLGSSTPCNVVAAMSDEAITISGRSVTLYVNGSGTWKVTALIEA